MITITQIDRNRISLRCHYAYRSRCHNVPGAEFDRSRKAWVAPISSLPYILEEFKGELYFKTPLWKLEGKAAPPKEKISFLGLKPEAPKLLLKPYRYQEDGIRFMIDRLNNVGFCLNGDGVGLGKSLEAIGTVKWFVENRGVRKILVICKKSLKSQWASEIRKISGWDNVPIFTTGGSTKKKKQEVYNNIMRVPSGILIANYQDFLNWKDELDKVNFDICIIDEAHCVKGRDSKMNALISDSVNGKMTILLTGTPIMSRPDDIWGIVHLCAPNFFGEYKEFKKQYIREEFNRERFYTEIIGAKNLDELKEKMSLFLIMRTAEDAAIDLPKQRPAKNISCNIDSVQEKMQGIINDRKSKMEERKKKLVEEYGLTERTMSEINQINDLSKMYIATLQFVSDDPALFKEDNAYMPPRAKKNINDHLGKIVPDSYKMSSKTEAAIDIVSELVDADEKVIIFCHFASSARMLKSHFDKIQGANTVMYTGAENEEQRDANIDAFRSDPECRVLIGTEAMAEGLNLQVARHIIHYEQADTYAQREQRNGRIRRIGSAYDYINVIDIVTEGAFDEIKLQKLRKDYVLTGAMLG